MARDDTRPGELRRLPESPRRLRTARLAGEDRRRRCRLSPSLRDPEEGHVRGLTTAAAIWVTALVGVASGAGAFREVCVGFVLAIAVLFLGGPIERVVRRAFRQSPADGG
jgi:hypothetical protein